MEKLPPAPPAPPRMLTDAELIKLKVHEESTLRELRLFLRDIWNKLAKCRKFAIFMRPVDIEDVSKNCLRSETYEFSDFYLQVALLNSSG